MIPVSFSGALHVTSQLTAIRIEGSMQAVDVRFSFQGNNPDGEWRWPGGGTEGLGEHPWEVCGPLLGKERLEQGPVGGGRW